jgi:hypothetical protein
MTQPGRLVLAMILLVVVTSCVVGAVTYYFATRAPPVGVLEDVERFLKDNPPKRD